jgi:hypothetical protein
VNGAIKLSLAEDDGDARGPGGLRRDNRRGNVVTVESVPEKDRPVFASAQRCKATHFLTGDRRHFAPYMNVPKDTMGIVVQTVGDFLSARPLMQQCVTPDRAVAFPSG